MRERLPGLKFLAFALLCVGFTAWLVVMIGNLSFAAAHEYTAEFDDVSGLLVNDEVKIAGVTLGRVQAIEHLPRGRAQVTFSVEDDVEVPADSEVVVRWKNVFGLRFLYVEPGEGEPVEPGHGFGREQTRAPADIGSLLQRLAPFMQSLQPEKQNQILRALSTGLVGREDEVRSLIERGGELTQAIATRDAEIESLLQDSVTTLEAYAEREQQLRGLLDSFSEVSTTLSARNDEIEAAIVGLADGQEELRRFVEDNEADIHGTIDALEDLTDVTSQHRAELERTIRTAPQGFLSYHLISRTGQWFNVRGVGFSLDGTVISSERGARYPQGDGTADGGTPLDELLGGDLLDGGLLDGGLLDGGLLGGGDG